MTIQQILYDDGDEEMLNLKKQRWELVDVDVSLDGGSTKDPMYI